jgi:hypothetical protein
VQRVAGSQSDAVLVRKSRRRAELLRGHRQHCEALSLANAASASARWLVAIWPVRNLIDSADENSVATQPLIARSSGDYAASQACTRIVALSLVRAAINSDVSR